MPKTIESVLKEDGYLIYKTTGISMEPLLKQNRDIIQIKAKESGRYKKYDVVLFKKEGAYILHRILKVREKDYIIVGDNCVSGDVVTDDQILGVLTRIKRRNKEIETSNRLYMLYVHLWCDLKLPRRVYHKLHSLCHNDNLRERL